MARAASARVAQQVLVQRREARLDARAQGFVGQGRQVASASFSGVASSCSSSGTAKSRSSTLGSPTQGR